MAFGQSPGPPASAKQMAELLALLQDAGHTGFRDARGPMGFTQRQGAGKFTRDEAASLIERLQAAPSDGTDPGTNDPPVRISAAERTLRAMPAEELAAELQRRGWVVLEP